MASRFRSNDDPATPQRERGRYEQVREPVGVLYDANGAQIGPYKVHDPRNRRALPQNQIAEGTGFFDDPWGVTSA